MMFLRSRLALRAGQSCFDACESSFLPFLYQTRTIQRSYASGLDDLEASSNAERRKTPTGRRQPERSATRGRPSTRGRNVDGRSSDTAPRGRRPQQRYGSAPNTQQSSGTDESGFPGGFLPFEKGTPNASVLDRMDRSTMTPREIHIFEELLRKGAQVKKTKEESDKATRESIGDRGFRPDDKWYGASAPERPKPEFPEAIRHLAEEATTLRGQAAAVDATSEEYRMSVITILDLASTDADAWKVLDDHVFQRLRDFELDPRDQPGARIERQRDLQVLTDTLPDLLLHFINLMNTSFPGSTLGLAVLPALKKVGPSAFVLGATTDLFNEHMRILYRQYSDIDAVVEVLSDMDKEVYEYNVGTKELIRSIFKRANAATWGHLGRGLQAFWSTDRKQRALQKLGHWNRKVDESLHAAAVKRAQQKAADELEERELDEDEDEDTRKQIAVA